VTIRAPPRSATWLLERFGADSGLEPLIGDLAEQFAQGRSRVWYCRQTAGALAFQLGRTLRIHAVSFIAAVLVGCLFNALWRQAVSVTLQPLYKGLREATPHPWCAAGLIPFVGLLALAASNGALSFISVWVVTRIHRAHPRTLLVAFVLALTVLRVPGIVRLAVQPATDARVSVSLNIEIVMTALQAIFTLVAGLWSFRHKRFAEMDRRIRLVAIALLAQVFVASVLYSAWRVGALFYSRPEGYLLDALELASGAYLAFLLWRPSSGPRRAHV
jgi:hypothetical protein